MVSSAFRVRLERPDACRERDFLDACRRSRALHRGVVTTPVTPADYRAYLNDTARPTQESFFVVIAATGELAGVVDVLEIVREAPAAGRLGYFAFLPHAGRGLMREGVGIVLGLAFGELGLSLLNADIQPANRRSHTLAASLGFVRSGQKRSLRIGSRWIAHERWVLRASAAGASPQPGAGRA